MADAAFAELLAGEHMIRAEMDKRVQRPRGEISLRQLGLAGGEAPACVPIAASASAPPKQTPKFALAEDRSLDALLARAAGKMANVCAVSTSHSQQAQPPPQPLAPLEADHGPAQLSRLAARKGGLDSVLALRKAQLGKAAIAGQLRSLRSGKDSDDEEEEEDMPANTVVDLDDSQRNITTFDRALNMLGDNSVATRHCALKQLLTFKLNRSQHKALLRPLLLRFADPAERCRDSASQLFEKWVDAADAADVSGCLPFLVPVLVERLGTQETPESSEEIRAKLVTICTTTMYKARNLLRPYLNELGAICLGACRDSHPSVIKAACTLVALVGKEVLPPLVKLMGGKAVQPYSAKLVEALLPHLRHRHAAVRVATLEALEHTLLAGAGSSVEALVGWRLANNVPISEFYGKGEVRRNWLADLSRDGSPQVRRRFLATLTRWLREMDGADLYEQEVRLFPYLLNLLVDPDAAIRTHALCAVTALGDEYLEQHEAEYREKVEYGHAEEAKRDARLNIDLPHPFDGRPPFGARVRVRNHFRALIHPIIAELDCWTAKERVQSAALLEVLLIFVEDSATEFGHMILPAISKAAADSDDRELHRRVCRCAEVFAHHVDARSYMPLFIQMSAQDPLNTLSQRLGCYRILPSLLHGMYRVLPENITAKVDRVESSPSSTPSAHADAVLAMLCGVAGRDGAAIAQHTPLREAARELLIALCALEREARLPMSDHLFALSTAREKLEPLPLEVYSSPLPVPNAPRSAALTLGLLMWHGSEPSIATSMEHLKAAEAQAAIKLDAGVDVDLGGSVAIAAVEEASANVTAAWAAVEQGVLQDLGSLVQGTLEPLKNGSLQRAPRPPASDDAVLKLLQRFYAKLHPLLDELSQRGAPFVSELLERLVQRPIPASNNQPNVKGEAASGSAAAEVAAPAPAHKVLAVFEVDSFDEDDED